ncbi:ATP-binding protein [Lewinella sp. 4G2]|uniref:ATP-binding protein n=1 Tax=Lewinella sp. 4G2 TaxID=1803372 RepID=UPI0007B4CFDB|nr:AAA family ATPase [Lewinella sp. 4G2]OAV44227.1 hypothetical protein A3850_006840 [Lewinella sp. 4G2]
MLERLYRLSEDAVRSTDTDFIRPLYHTIDWDSSLNALLGARGVGKTTLLLQRLQALDLPPSEALYVDLGDLHFQRNRLLEFAQEFRAQGGRYLFIDEVHRYGFGGDWAQEIKQIYDLYRKDLKVTFTGSSAIRILQQKADLSRRATQHRVAGLSFREYLILAKGIQDLPVLSVEELLKNSVETARQIPEQFHFRPLEHFRDYLDLGYYPFSLEGTTGYISKLNESVQLVLESDIPSAIDSGEADYAKLGRLLYAIASSVPFKPNISKLAERLQMSRETVLKYLKMLEEADLVISLRAVTKGVAALSKPDKIYLNNTNLMRALAPVDVAVGTLRETFFINQLRHLTFEKHILPTEIKLPKAGDFTLLRRDGTYTFEIGGPSKTRKQIGTDVNSFAVVDTDVTDDPHRIPLWLFGFLY